MDQNMKNFVESNISNDFGLTVEQVAQQCRTYGRFSAWLNQDVSRIINVLNIVKNQGVSPAFFASYEKSEGYNSSWGWLNHTSVNGTPTQDAQSVSQWIVTQSQNMSDKPAWIDFANYNDFVPESVKQEGNTHFQSLPSGTIGRVVIAGTAAATWEIYYPNGLKKEYNGVQDYGPPLIAMMDTIREWGGNIEGGSGVVNKPAFPTTLGLTVTSPYGYRGDIGVPGASEYHWAIDIGGAGVNHPIYATQDAIVIHNREFTGGGWGLILKHTGDPYYSRYLHLANKSPIAVGSRVTKGQEIAIMGSTGVSSGIHLDFAISVNGTFGTEQDTIDPLLYLDMTFGGGGSSGGNKQFDYINLLLLDVLAGWKW